jgi:hypothetical protein
MSIKRFLSHSMAGWCAVLLVAAVIVLAFYGETKVFTPDGFGILPVTAIPYKTLEDGYLVQHQPESPDVAKLTGLGKMMGMNVVQIPQIGVAYFENTVPQRVIDHIVAQYYKNAPDSPRPGVALRFFVKKRIEWLRFSGLIAAALLGALAIQGLAAFDLPRRKANG